MVCGGRPAGAGEPLNTPLIPASNFILGQKREYARDDGIPSWEALEEVVGGLEGGHSVAFSSGMAAIAAVLDQLMVGAQVVIPTDCYQGVVELVQAGVARRGWKLQRLPVSDTQAWVHACIVSDLVWLESPTNPLLEVADIESICRAPRKDGTMVVVDNTFATPLNQQPILKGATISIQSVTKFIGGHSDLLAGVATTRDAQLWKKLQKGREMAGATPGALEVFLALRGIRTLAIRLERAQENAIVLAERLQQHSKVKLVQFPGLSSHPTHTIAARTLKGFGTVISFDLEGGADEADTVCRSVKLIQHATSLGAVESTIERRAAIPGQGHLPPSLLRLSVGIENVEDIWNDLEKAMCFVEK